MPTGFDIRNGSSVYLEKFLISESVVNSYAFRRFHIERFERFERLNLWVEIAKAFKKILRGIARPLRTQ